jgi:predicted acylesterase/phospholipase RssA
MTEAVSDPRTLECDLIMKGGVTSGLVYPGAIARIARRYTIRSIGGTSAGAIAAAAAAAMELGIASGRVSLPCALALMRGLSTEAAMPTCRGNSLLEALFTADGVFQKPFDLIKQQLRSPGAGTGGLAFMAAAWRAAPAFLPAYLMVKAAAGLFAAVVIGLLLAGPLGAPVWLAFALAGVLGFLGLAWALVSGLANGLSELASRWQGQGWGIATGMARPGPDACDRALPALTEWLHQKFQTLAGLDDDEPITFGHLWKPGAPAEASSRSPHRQTSLVLVATDLNRMLSVQFPFLPGSERLFFDRQQMEALFPPAVVAALVREAWYPHEERAPQSWQPDRDHPNDTPAMGFRRLFGIGFDDVAKAAPAERWPRLYLLPKARHLPIILGVRASMAFPGLYTPLPLWLLRRGRETKSDQPGESVMRYRFDPVLLSDGGISSNFPIHLFDAPVPGRPTFAINLLYEGDEITGEAPLDDGASAPTFADSGVIQLRGGDPDDDAAGASLLSTLFMPKRNAGMVQLYKLLPQGTALGRVGGFAMRVVEAARTWGDVSLYSLPGMRDRIIHVRLSSQEGGFNLGMDPGTIARLCHKGHLAGAVLALRFDPVRPLDLLNPDRNARLDLNWHNHRFVRLRSLLAAQERLADGFGKGWGNANLPGIAQSQPGLGAILKSWGNSVEHDGHSYFVGYKARLRQGQRGHLQAMAAALPDLVNIMPMRFKSATVSAGVDAPNPPIQLRQLPAGDDPLARANPAHTSTG